jgi:putative ABC transport system permease protein
MDALLQDVRYALRVCLRTPGFTAVALLALALGIGANTAIFTIVNAVLLERLPFRDPDRLVVLWEESSRRPDRSNVVSPANYLRWRERATAFAGMSAFADTRLVMTGDGNPEELTAQLSMGDLFQVLAVPPLLGRTFTEAELVDPSTSSIGSSGATVTVLSHAFWQRRFGRDPAVLGRTIQLNSAPATIIGVMPPDVRLLMKSNSLVGKPTDLWLPFALPETARTPRGRSISVIARLKPDVSLAQARSQMNTIAAGLAIEFPDFDTGWTVRVLSLREELAGDLRPALLMLAGAVAFVLLIACANVANLLLARGAARGREIAIRTALGAARARVVRQLLTESLVLGLLGGALGLLVAQWSLDALLAVSPIDFSQLGQVHLSYPVLAFTGIVSLFTAVVCGLAPALEGARVDVQESLNDGARQIGAGVRHRRLRHAFVIAEVALAVVLLAGAGLLLRSFASLRSVDPGMDTHNVLTMRTALPGRKYNEPGKTLRFYAEAVRRIGNVPSVQSAGMISYLPFTGLGAGTRVTIVGQPPPAPGQDLVTDVTVCDNGYFETMRVPLVRGRLFTEREMRERSNVVIVNEAFATRYFPGEDPIGKQVVIAMNSPNVPTEIIGIVANSKFSDLRTDVRPSSYWPHPQLPYTAMTFAVRTASDPALLAPVVEREIQSIDKDQPVSDVRTMDQWIARSLAQARFSSLLLGVFAALALALASIGIYGVMSYAVGQRTSEIGIRLALGAERRDILSMIVGSAMRLAAAGLVIGVLLATALSRTLTTLLYQTTGTDPLTFAAVVLILGAVALLASYVPARRASRIAPVEALRYQ